MNQEELQVAAFEIILHSGTARTEIHEAFADMREGRFDEAEAKLEHSNEENFRSTPCTNKTFARLCKWCRN